MTVPIVNLNFEKPNDFILKSSTIHHMNHTNPPLPNRGFPDAHVNCQELTKKRKSNNGYTENAVIYGQYVISSSLFFFFK
jgi:hypothetical protein